MDLKNAVAVCLISLFSATLVVLVARSLDNQAALRLEPQLTAIVEELRAIRSQGGMATAPGTAPQADAVRNGLIVYYFHSNARCATCRSIELQAQDTVQTHFAAQLGKGDVVWKIVNYDQPAAKALATKFDIQMPVVVLAKMKDGQIQDWKRLDEVWALVSDKPAFAKFVREEIERMLASEKQTTPAAATIPSPSIDTTSEKEPPAIPLP